jgi:hypothetical protein
MNRLCSVLPAAVCKRCSRARRVVAGVLAFAGLALSSGCGPRDHLRADHGQATHEFFTRQRVWKTAADQRPEGLDSEEATLIHSRYRASLGNDNAPQPTEPARVLLIEDSNKANDARR